MADDTRRRARRLLTAAEHLRSRHTDDCTGRSCRADKAAAALLEVEGNVRLTQPRGFYEVPYADELAAAILSPIDDPRRTHHPKDTE